MLYASMEYNTEDSGATGNIPEFGAIFMSSIVTKKECFKRQVFALPSSKAEFVKHVKIGMVLFLFEFERRILYGVYRASSNGAMDIVPDSFNYQGKRLPAQVCFTPIWHCKPLAEEEFRDAIKENYFSPKKFYFGLSKDQVQKLLNLFSSRQLENKLPPFGLPEAVDGIDGKDRGQTCHDNFPLSERGGINRPSECHGFKPAVLHDYQMNSLERDDEDEYLIDVRGNAEDNLYPLVQGGFLAKRRRMDNDHRLIRTEVEENEIYDNEISHAFPIDSLKDSLDEVGRFDTALERFPEENRVDAFHNPFHKNDYLMSPLDVRATGDDQFMQSNRFGKYKMEHVSGVALASECYSRDDGRFRSTRAGNKEVVHTRISPLASEYPSFSKQNLNVSPFLDMLPEKRLFHPSASHNFVPSSSMYEDAIITRPVPYEPEHTKLSHGCPLVATNHGQSGLVMENHHRHGSLENLHSSRSRFSPYFSESKLSTEAMDITPECADEALYGDTSGQLSFFHHKTPFLRSDPSRQTTSTLDISAPVNYRSSIRPNISLTSLRSHGQRNIERERGYFPCPTVSSESNFAFDRNLAGLSRVVNCAPHKECQERGIFLGNDVGCSEANYFCPGVYDQVRDLTSNGIKFSGSCSNMNQKGHREVFEAPHCNSNGNRKSVFTRLTSRQESWVDKERSGTNLDSIDHSANATVDDVMEMLQQGNNKRNMKNRKIVGKSKQGGSEDDEKQIQSNAEMIHSGNDKIDETHSTIGQSVHEVPKETRVVNFKRRSHTDIKKSVARPSKDPTEDHKTMDANKVVESSTAKTLKRKRLVRPVFGKVESAADSVYSNNKNLLLVVLEKDDKLNCSKAVNKGKAEVPEKAISNSEAKVPEKAISNNEAKCSRIIPG